MLRDLASAIETLQEGGARYYQIEGNQLLIKYEPEADTHTVDDAIDRFAKDWDKLAPGMYKVTHKAKASANRGQAMFRISKQAEGGVHGIGDPYGGTSNLELQKQIWNLEKSIELNDLKRRYEDEISKLKAKESEPDGMSRLMGAIGSINSLLNNPVLQRAAVTGAKQAPVRSLPQPAVAAPGENEETNQIASAIQAIHQALGGDDGRTVELFSKLETMAKENPDQLRGYSQML